MQVELALMMYRLPRLTRLWTHLERQSSGGRLTTVYAHGRLTDYLLPWLYNLMF
jgi:hypothetical protein